MFQFHVITIFPEIFQSFLSTSIMGKAVDAGLIHVRFVDPRTFATDKHRSVDDTPYGGGHGMVMKPDPLVSAIESVPDRPHRVLLCPQGERLTQAHLADLAGRESVLMVCGRYEGYDERVRSFVDQEISLGDFVLGGGDVAAMALMEGVARLVPGVIGNEGSLATESHTEPLLEHPQYTRPRRFRDLEVPEVLLGGNHAEIERWRREQMLTRTHKRRPDLFARHRPTEQDVPILRQMEDGQSPKQRGDLAARTTVALVHHPVFNRMGEVVTTAVTNLDLHDIARSSRTYGLAGYLVATPLTSQQELVRRILSHWHEGHGSVVNPRRGAALRLLDVCASLDAARRTVAQREGREPLVVVTSAVKRPGQVSQREVVEAAADGRPLLLVLGTGWGLTDEALAQADLCMAPIRGRPRYNHLSVRSAAAILLDRLFGMRQ